MDITQPKLDWMDDKLKEIGEKLGNELWNSRKIVTDKKSKIQLPISLNTYYESFPNFLRKTKTTIAFPYLGIWFTQVMANMSQKSRLFFSFRKLLSTLYISGHTDRPNIWNLVIIDNIDFKEKSFTYGNIFDTIRKSSHTTLQMAFQMWMPIPLKERADDKKNVTFPTGLFGMNDLMKDIWDKFDDIIDNLLNFLTSSEGQLLYNTNFDMAVIHQKILESVDHGCLADAPNIVILETGGIPNSDEGIFRSTEIYKQDFNLEPDDYLNVVADEAIFRRLIKQKEVWPKLHPILGQWYTFKNMCRVLIILFSSYGIFDLAKVSGVKFLDKLDKIVDYRSTVHVLELIWLMPIVFYEYKLQKNALAYFVSLFASAGKSNYSVSVTQYLGMLAQYPKLEEKLECVSSNITRNVVDDNKLKLQVKAAQSKHDRIEILLSEYLNDPCGSIGQRAVETYKMAMWKQITAASIEHLENCFSDGISRIEAIFLQDVISIQKSNKVGRRKLEITRWKPTDQNSKKKKTQLASSSNTENSISDQQVPTNSK
ncbi:hypothetical protein C1646_773121 [Rhizophagus diaphanus]|nr:hypothetical protein C1646_773121 [Rhizophagus diaphanus] [Rhizophagus sp. MUCL 43196]